jgi:pimeloyl-ACP methyl ester carboxylesterase
MPLHISPGGFFRHYRILERVGEGGMGVVYRARDTRLERDVALKFLHVQRSEHSDRLRREARALAALNHPNILTIHDMDEADGHPYLVLEWLGGGALSDQRSRTRLPEAAFLEIARPIAEALAAAHEHGIVHRDVKPANVLVTDDGRIKLADFGLAKLRELDADVTRTAGALGTVAYMSPEQASGEEIGPGSDIFSFGVLAYELLAGARPFTGPGPAAVIGAILSGRRVPLRELRSDLSDALVAIVERCLATDPSARFQNGRELTAALRDVGAGGTASVQPDAKRSDSAARVASARSYEQEIRFCRTADGIGLAYSTIGSGPVIARVLGHFTHLEAEWQWPDLRLFWERLADDYTVVRYDGRGMGLSDRYDGEFTEETRQLDLDAVLTAVGAGDAALLGISEGGWTSAQYALDHPGRITRLILYGSYCRGAQARPGYDREEDAALLTLIRKGWGRDTPAFRQVFTSQFFRADADPALIAHFNELQRLSADPETAARYWTSVHSRGDGRALFEQIRIPTLVVHGRDDLAVSADEGRLLASIIPGAQLVLLPSGAHYFPTDTASITAAAGAISRFLRASDGVVRRAGDL